MLRPCNCIAHLHKLLDGIPYLLIQDAAVGYHNNGIQHRTTILFKPDDLMSKPCDRVGFSAARTVLNQVFLSNTIRFYIGK